MTMLHVQIGLKSKETSLDLRFEIGTRREKKLPGPKSALMANTEQV